MRFAFPNCFTCFHRFGPSFIRSRRVGLPLLLLAVSLLLLPLQGCGWGTKASAVGPTSSVTLNAGQSVQIPTSTASGVSWTINGTGCSGSSCGSVTPGSGSILYTAPQTVASQLHATIDANLASVGSFGSIAVTVNPALTVAANLDAASVGVPYSGTITTSGGSNPVQTSIAAGSLPSGLALDSTGSKIAGTPSTAGSFTFTIKATDASNATTNVLTQKTIRVASTSTPVSVVTSSLPKATVGTAYATQLAATGGTSPYTWSILSGALPTGVTLVSSSGIIHGTPTASGTFGISVQATDKDGATATTTLSITVANAQPTLQITTTALASGTVGIPYTSAIDTSGGTAPYTCARVSGSLPAGLALNACTISGTPTASGTFSFSVSVTDSTGAYTAGTISLNIAASSLRVTTTLLPSGTVGTPYTTAITAAGGTAPYTCSIRSGTLPAGLALSGCNITGTPTTAGSSTLVLGVTDAAGISVASASLGLTIANAAPTLTISSPTSATVGASYAASIGIAGGTAPYSCSLTSGSLPTGISLSNCSLRGTPMASGVFALNISATDSSTPSGKGSGNISLVVQNAPPTLTITSPSTVTAGQVYSSAIGVRGGLAPYTCSLISGTLPSGLTLSNCNITGTTAVTGSNNLVIRATDSSSPAGTATSAITLTVVSPPATLTISSPPSGTVGAAYNGAIGVSGGTAPYTCALASGAVPAGLTLNGCSLSGIPTVAGNATFAIRATDASNPANSTTATVTLSIAAAPVTLTLTAPSAATAGVVYSGAIGVSGGTAPYTCALTSGFMPAGLTLNSCSITGTPTVAGTFNLNIRASDSATPANATTATVPLTIASTPVIPVTMTLTSTTTTGTVGSAYAGIIGISGGTAPYTCSLTSGSVPGLTLNNCTLTGTPTTAGTYSLSLRASDSASPANSTTGTIALTVNAAAVALSITSPSSGTVGTAYTGTIGVSGGTAPYTCSLASGTLPAGLTLSNCSFSGTPTAAGTTTLSIRATDASNPANAATGNVSITINATPVFGSSSAPHINYTDINVGSGTGGDTGNGVYVRIFGNNFGATQGSSTVTLGGSLVTNCSLCSWSDTVIIAQLGSAAKTGNIIVTVNGSASNGMPFTVTATDIVFVSPNGADTNTGSFSSPYKTWRRAFNSVTSSDSSSPVRNTVIYLMPGTDVTFDDGRGYKAAISTDIGGSSATSQLNIVGYPGGTVNVGSTSVTNGIKGWGKYITAANLNIVGQVSAVDAEAGNVRIINNSISCPAPPSGVGGTACVLGETTDPTETWVFHGNNVHDTGGNVDKTYHAVYFSSNVNHAEVGWNNVGQNFKGYCRGIMFHATLGANQFDLHIHDNVVTNSYCDGIGLASVDPSQGTVEVYNNLVLHTALATNPYGVANEAGIAINSDPAPGSSTGNVEVYNNTVVDAGAYTTGNQNGCFGVVYSGAGMHLTNNICSQPSSAQPYVEKGSTNVSGSHNLWYGAGSAPSWDTNPVNANPLFTSATDFSLQSGSPAKATGTSSNASSVDIVGNSRGSTPSMGAYQ